MATIERKTECANQQRMLYSEYARRVQANPAQVTLTQEEGSSVSIDAMTAELIAILDAEYALDSDEERNAIQSQDGED